MYTQNPNFPMYGNQPMAFGYGAKPMPRCTQPVTAEMSKLLHQEDDNLSVKISRPDSIRNQCTHKEPGTGDLALNYNADGSVTCRTCGETFNIIAQPEGEIEDACNHVIDILQTIKLQYIDAPEEFVKEYFQLISLLKNAPRLYKKSLNNFASYEAYSNNAMYPINPGMNAFQAVGNIMSINPMQGYAGQWFPQQPYAGQPMPQQPVMPQQPMAGQPYVAPQWNGAPQWTQQPAAPQQMGQPGMMENPMAYGTVGVAPSPAPVQAPVAQPAVPPQNAEVQQTKTFAV